MAIATGISNVVRDVACVCVCFIWFGINFASMQFVEGVDFERDNSYIWVNIDITS